MNHLKSYFYTSRHDIPDTKRTLSHYLDRDNESDGDRDNDLAGDLEYERETDLDRDRDALLKSLSALSAL